MEKSHDALKTIGEMSHVLGVQPHILRYWEEQFNRLNPLKRAGGRRYYRVEDAVLLHEIHRLIYVEGYTIKGAQKYLRDAKKSGGLAAASTPLSQNINRDQFPPPNDNIYMSDEVRTNLKNIADGLRKALAA